MHVAVIPEFRFDSFDYSVTLSNTEPVQHARKCYIIYLVNHSSPPNPLRPDPLTYPPFPTTKPVTTLKIQCANGIEGHEGGTAGKDRYRQPYTWHIGWR
jgi:hypothetical protein